MLMRDKGRRDETLESEVGSDKSQNLGSELFVEGEEIGTLKVRLFFASSHRRSNPKPRR
jgi:hypothetical protein